MSYTDGAWSEPVLPLAAATEDSELFFWRVPTSIFFGLMPTKLGDAVKSYGLALKLDPSTYAPQDDVIRPGVRLPGHAIGAPAATSASCVLGAVSLG